MSKVIFTCFPGANISLWINVSTKRCLRQLKLFSVLFRFNSWSGALATPLEDDNHQSQKETIKLRKFDEQNQSQDILLSSISRRIIQQVVNHAIQEIFEEVYAFHLLSDTD